MSISQEVLDHTLLKKEKKEKRGQATLNTTLNKQKTH